MNQLHYAFKGGSLNAGSFYRIDLETAAGLSYMQTKPQEQINGVAMGHFLFANQNPTVCWMIRSRAASLAGSISPESNPIYQNWLHLYVSRSFNMKYCPERPENRTTFSNSGFHDTTIAIHSKNTVFDFDNIFPIFGLQVWSQIIVSGREKFPFRICFGSTCRSDPPLFSPSTHDSCL
jgi:hypothetical protein